MANRFNQHPAPENPQKPNSTYSGYSPNAAASKTYHSSNIASVDELIAHLANAHENRRARQVNEWEQMPRQYVH
jgi:hypothetical protein